MALEFFDDKDAHIETLDVFWFINHYVSRREANRPEINQEMFL